MNPMNDFLGDWMKAEIQKLMDDIDEWERVLNSSEF